VTFFMAEIAVADFDASLAWYRDRLGLKVELVDAANRFVLLRCQGGGRLALKAGIPSPGGVRLHFEVSNLDEELTRFDEITEPPKASAEGYRRAVVRDPDGYTVCLFEWVAH
jgi:catechol 2,3-dioxygenase-like lactoylglutathione lyase family enzyme